MAQQRPAPSGSKAANARGRQPATPGPRRPTSGRAADPRPIPAPFLTHPPGEPTTPDEPAGPDEPTTPDEPVDSSETTTPVEPVDPGETTTPVEPVDPGAQSRFSTRDESGTPGGPADLSAPSDLGTPSEPDQPRQPDEPGQPEALGNASNPGPAVTSEPDATADPAPDSPQPVTAAEVETADLRHLDPATADTRDGDGQDGNTRDGDGQDEPTQLIAPRPVPRPVVNRGPATGRAAAPGHSLRRTVNQRGVAKVPVRRDLQAPVQRQQPVLGLCLQPMVHVADMPAAVAFYEAFGGEVVHGDRGGEWVLMQVGTAQVGLVVRPPDPARGESTVELNFSAAMPLDRLEQLLRERGVTIVEVATDAELGTRLHVETPDGMPVKIHHIEPDPLV